MSHELWPHQAEGLEALRQTVKSRIYRIVLCAPTGSGKTRLSAAVINSAVAKGKRVAFVISNLSLIDQSLEAFYEQGITDVGVLQGNHILQDWSKPIQIASVQTLSSRDAYPRADIVIIDECHVLHAFHKKWMSDPEWQNVPFIGLSATPGTRGLGKYFQTLLTISTTQELIEKGFLSPFKVYAGGHPDLSDVKIVAGDYQEDQLSAAMQKGELTADIIRTWQEKWGKNKTLCYAVDCAHAQSIQERFLNAGISAGYQDARTPADERREIKRKFHNGELQVVCNVGTLTTGTDWNVHCLILARPTRSQMLYVQIHGRALRTAPDKQSALILDHSDSTQRLGFVTDIHFDTLDDGKPKKKSILEKVEPLPKECKACGYLKPPKTKICPNCGHETKIKSEIMEADGELVEIRPGQRAKGRKHEFSERERKQWYAELTGYAAGKPFKPSWPSMKYKEKFGKFPPWGWRDSVRPMPCSPAIEMWIRSRNIAFHKGKMGREAYKANQDRRGDAMVDEFLRS